MTANISIPDHPDNLWCPVCLESWLPDMVPVRIRVRWHHEVICGKCAREMGVLARKEERRRRLESEAVRGRKRPPGQQEGL